MHVFYLTHVTAQVYTPVLEADKSDITYLPCATKIILNDLQLTVWDYSSLDAVMHAKDSM